MTDTYRGADKSLGLPGRKQAWKHVRDARDFNNIETRAVIKFFLLQDKAPKEIHAILTETLTCFLPDRAKDLSAPLYIAGESRRIIVVKVGGESSYCCLLYVLPSLTFKIWAYAQPVLLMQQIFSQRILTD